MENTIEQQKCLELFSQGGNLRISAYAGSGKTATLKLLAESTPKTGYYLAYNKSIADEASGSFPDRVRCATSHRAAFTPMKAKYDFSSSKIGGSASPHTIAEVLDLPLSTQISKRRVLQRAQYSDYLQHACSRFLSSACDAPSIEHFQRNHSSLIFLSENELDGFVSDALLQLKKLWRLMCDPSSPIPLGHDGYLKLWALSNPKISADYILLDEAQDSNPAILKVLAAQTCQVVYVEDPYQQIYEWRGAVDAMSRVETQHQTLLSKSFRFGTHIAEAATRVIANLGATSAVIGNERLDSHVCDVYPNAILCRGNAGLIGSLLTLLAKDVRCCVVGGTKDLQGLLKDVSRLKQGIPSTKDELFGFQNWSEVQQHSQEFEDAVLKKLVKMVDEHGEQRLLRALGSCEVDEKSAQVVLSTAHKAKGCQWDYVEIDRDFAKAFDQFDASSAKSPSGMADMRLLYVAITRARLGVSIPSTIRDVFQLQNTTNVRQGSNRGFSLEATTVFPGNPVQQSTPAVAVSCEAGALPVPRIKEAATKLNVSDKTSTPPETRVKSDDQEMIRRCEQKAETLRAMFREIEHSATRAKAFLDAQSLAKP